MIQVTTFWNYFKKNEQAIINAFLLGIHADVVYAEFDKKLSSISLRIGFEIRRSINNQGKCRILFTAFGYRKLFPKIMALENLAPPLEFFIVEGFIKPFEDVEKYKNGTDAPLDNGNYTLKISEFQMGLREYTIATKQLRIDVYLPRYNEIKQHKDLRFNMNWIVMEIIGELAFRKHIKEIQLHQMPLEPVGLLPLIDLPDLMAYLYESNSRRKRRPV